MLKKRPCSRVIPAPLLANMEQLAKSLAAKELPEAITRLGITNRINKQPSSGDPSIMPVLTVNADCCYILTLVSDLAQGYGNAISANGLKTGEESALLTVKKATIRHSNFWNPSASYGRNEVAAVLSFRGNEYWIEDSGGLFGSFKDVCAAIGQLALEKIRSAMGLPARQDKSDTAGAPTQNQNRP